MTRPFVVDPQTIGADEALSLVRSTISDVIDLSTPELNHDRPAWGMDVLHNLRAIEEFIGEIAIAQSERKEAAE